MNPTPTAPRCSALSRDAGESPAGTAPRADVWVVVEHPDGWGDAPWARAGHGVRVVMARGLRAHAAPGGDPTSSGCRVWVAHCACDPVLRVGSATCPDEVAGWDLAEVAAGALRSWGRPVEDPLLAVCANGRRDRCCGHGGGRLADALWTGPHRKHVVTCTHLGGHRFAPTALLLPWGVLHGRLDLARAEELLVGAASGWTPTETLRGSSTQDQPAQVAEVHARRVTGYRGLAPLPVALEGDTGRGRATARVALPDGSALDVLLVRSIEQQVLSCGHGAEPVTHWSVAG